MTTTTPIYELPSTKSSSSPPVPTSPSISRPLYQESSRSITELSPKDIPKVHKHHHHPHLHHRRDKDGAGGEKGGERNSGGGNSGIGGSERGSRSEGATPQGSRDVSRRGSGFWGEDNTGGAWGGLGLGLGGRGERRSVREGEVQEERERGVLRASELRNALMSLNTMSNTTTRRLDNTYYSVLEKLSILQSTIVSMKELANMTRALNGEFQSEAKEVERDINAQINGFDNFEKQEKRIQGLQKRVDIGRERIKVLAKRVDVVKEQVDEWEKAELEWQDKTRKRLRFLWIIISICGAIFVGMTVFQYTPATVEKSVVANGTGLNTTGLLGIIPKLEGRNQTGAEKGVELEGLKKTCEKLGDDPRLRIFDEL